MGRSFFNLMAKGATQALLAHTLTTIKYQALISPTYGDVTAIFPRDWDDDLPRILSSANHCTILSIQIFDGDILFYWLYVDGNLVDTYDSYPGYLEPVPNARYAVPEGGDVKKLCAAFGVEGAARAVARILRFPNWQLGVEATKRYMNAENRYRDLATVLGLPLFNRDYYSFHEDEMDLYIRTPVSNCVDH
ncbi:MAG: hypothetical protein ACYDAR_07090 [Thermomicrobiales bacterium]